jgi:hypothetical protein
LIVPGETVSVFAPVLPTTMLSTALPVPAIALDPVSVRFSTFAPRV